jgi:hypothetical protein
MKKVFLLFAVGAMIASAVAQKGPAVMRNLTPAKKNVIDDKNKSLGPVQVNKAVGLTTFTTSGNGYTLTSGKKLTADQQSKTVVYTSRAGGAFGATSNDIKMSYTSDYGVTFDSVLFANGVAHRYPGGSLFRTASGLFVICSGPITTTGWTGNYLFTSKIDGTLAADTTFANPPATEVGSFMLNDEIVVLPTGEAFILGEKSGPAANSYPHINYSIWKLKWNEGTSRFNFVDSTEFTPLLSTVQPPVQPTGMAFSADGSKGYFWVNGMDSITRPNFKTQPLVWKTIDKGETWSQMPIYDFSQVQEFKDYLWPIREDSTVVRPVFEYGYTNSDKFMQGTVDVNGNLHLFARVAGGYSSLPDSLGFSYANEPKMMFDLYTTATGWAARYIDTLGSDVDEGDNVTFGDFSLDHRMHISKTEDGTRLFYTWTDSPLLDVTLNQLPNVISQGYDVVNSTVAQTTNFTLGTPLEGSCLYMNASDIALFDNNKFTIPVVIISGSTPESEIGHQYLSDISLVFNDVSVKNSEKNIAKITNVYPNPTNGLSYMKISLENSSNVTIEVINMMGQVVSSENLGNKTAGTQQITINASGLTSGIYFVNVKAGNSSSTCKMVVK